MRRQAVGAGRSAAAPNGDGAAREDGGRARRQQAPSTPLWRACTCGALATLLLAGAYVTWFTGAVSDLPRRSPALRSDAAQASAVQQPQQPHAAPNASQWMMLAVVGRAGSIGAASTAEAATERGVALPPPVLTGPNLGGAGSRAMAMAIMDAGCPNPYSTVNIALDTVFHALPPWVSLDEPRRPKRRLDAAAAATPRGRKALIEAAGRTLLYDHVVRASEDGNGFRATLRDYLMFHTREERAAAIARPSEAFAAMGYPGACWSYKSARVLLGLPITDVALHGGWSLVHLIRDPRDMVLSDNRDTLADFRTVLLEPDPDAPPHDPRMSRRVADVNINSKLCSDRADDPATRAMWEVVKALVGMPAHEVAVQQAADMNDDMRERLLQSFRNYRDLAVLWEKMVREVKLWASNRLRKAERGDAPPFGYLLAHIEAIATGSLNTFEAEQDDAAVVASLEALKAFMGVTSDELVEEVNGELYAWIDAGTPKKPGDPFNLWHRGEDFRQYRRAGGRGRRLGVLDSAIVSAAEGARKSEGNALDAQRVEQLKGGTTKQIGKSAGKKAYVPTEHYGKWRTCTPGFVEWVESLVSPTMRKVGYIPQYFDDSDAEEPVSPGQERYEE